jgi:hypothetical protein
MKSEREREQRGSAYYRRGCATYQKKIEDEEKTNTFTCFTNKHENT